MVPRARACACESRPSALLVPALWFGPELWGSGEPLRASSRANNPNPGSAAFADHPGLEVAKRFHERTIVPLEALAALAAGVAVVAFRRSSGAGCRSSPWPAPAWPGSASWRS